MASTPREVLKEALAASLATEFASTPAALHTFIVNGFKGLDRHETPQLMALATERGLLKLPEVTKAVNALVANPDTRVIRWKTKWSHGDSSWESKLAYFKVGCPDAGIEEYVGELGDQEGGYSEHYRGVAWEDVTRVTYENALKPTTQLDPSLWDKEKGRWQSHKAFDTVNHTHVACYDPADGCDSCEILLIECQDGRFYLEDWWGDAQGEDKVWNPRDPEASAGPHFFASYADAYAHAVSVVARIGGVPASSIS